MFLILIITFLGRSVFDTTILQLPQLSFHTLQIEVSNHITKNGSFTSFRFIILSKTPKAMQKNTVLRLKKN